jgi:hypothetical protein
MENKYKKQGMEKMKSHNSCCEWFQVQKEDA